ncbi:hypothetical protein HWV62_20624 [Athelia sp. TMB]|nr:hypothetical protein HWV62_20624 [Athelia sp. TMB]
MDEAAWRYAHGKQLILDGTFGVCSSRLLLFIAMAVDDDGKGLPIAFFLFSAPTGNKATHTGYNRQIIGEVLAQWRDHLSSGRTCTFCPLVTITDPKERGGLQDDWPDIWLLLLFTSTDHTLATQLIEHERAHVSAFSRVDPSAKCASDAAVEYLDYLILTWMPLSLWQSWSEFGRLVASAMLKIPIEGVLPTTNHLESFNRLLKRKYLPLWQHSGSWLRFDFLISVLITNILPQIFANRRANEEYTLWLQDRFSTPSNSASIIASLRGVGRHGSDSGRRLCWWRADVRRDQDAQSLLQRGCLYNITMHADQDGYEAMCASSSLIGAVYRLELQRRGYASCNCPDFINRGGACKHLRAFHTVVDGWIRHGQINPFIYPTSPSAAARARPITMQQPAGDPLNAPGHKSDPNVVSSTVDNLLTLQMLALQSGPSEEFYDGLDDDIITVEFDQSDHSSACSSPGVDVFKAAQLQQSHAGDAVTIQTQQRVNHIATKILPQLHGLATLASDSPLTRTPEVEELEVTLSTADPNY